MIASEKKNQDCGRAEASPILERIEGPKSERERQTEQTNEGKCIGKPRAQSLSLVLHECAGYNIVSLGGASLYPEEQEEGGGSQKKRRSKRQSPDEEKKPPREYRELSQHTLCLGLSRIRGESFSSLKRR